MPGNTLRLPFYFLPPFADSAALTCLHRMANTFPLVSDGGLQPDTGYSYPQPQMPFALCHPDQPPLNCPLSSPTARGGGPSGGVTCSGLWSTDIGGVFVQFGTVCPIKVGLEVLIAFKRNFAKVIYTQYHPAT